MAHQIHTKYYSPYYPVYSQAHKAVLLHLFILTRKHPVAATSYTHENYNHTPIHTLTYITGYNYKLESLTVRTHFCVSVKSPCCHLGAQLLRRGWGVGLISCVVPERGRDSSPSCLTSAAPNTVHSESVWECI